ncbi:MAG: queuosine precursor transporter [Candidatus Methanomethylophilaceae archaeon]|nr:queuosine precursor transporter [Candidatus Methanomethylophilaceae archaeon]
MELKIPRTFITLVAVFVTSLVTANVLATKLFMFGDFILPAGVIAYPITFLMTDVIGEMWGKKVVTKVVWAGFFCSLLAMSLGFIAVMLPAAPFYERQEFFAELFGRVGRITGASLIAYIVSQLNDVWVFHKLKDLTHGKHLWLRNNVGTISSQLFDTILFITIAFYGIMPTSVLFSMIMSQWLIKILIALFDTPFCYWLVAWCRNKNGYTKTFRIM